MTLDLSTYERGYYGYMNQEVRDRSVSYKTRERYGLL